MHHLKHHEYALISGGNDESLGDSLTYYATLAGTTALGLYLGSAKAAKDPAHKFGYYAVGAILGGIAASPVHAGIENGIFEDYLNGRIGPVAARLWPFSRQKKAAHF